MNKLDSINNAFERAMRDSKPKTSERILSRKKGSPDFIRHQFIFSFDKLLEKDDDLLIDKNKLKPILDRIKSKYDKIYEEIENTMYEMEERITEMAKEDYALERDEDSDDVENEDIPGKMIEEFIREEWHHNIERRYEWAKDYFPDPSSFDIEDYDAFGTFFNNQVEPIKEQLIGIYEDYMNNDEIARKIIYRNKLNLFNFIFDIDSYLKWI